MLIISIYFFACNKKLHSGLAKLWHPYFGTPMVFCLSTISRKVKPLTATITWHYWIDWEQSSRKNGSHAKEKSAIPPRQCTCHKSMETMVKFKWIKFRIAFSYTIFSRSGPPPTTGSLLTWKNCSRKRDLSPMKKWLPKLRPILRAKMNHSTKKTSKI